MFFLIKGNIGILYVYSFGVLKQIVVGVQLSNQEQKCSYLPTLEVWFVASQLQV